MKRSDIYLLIAHAYILGSWFQKDLASQLLMLIVACFIMMAFIIVSKNELNEEMRELRFKFEKARLDMEERIEIKKERNRNRLKYLQDKRRKNGKK